MYDELTRSDLQKMQEEIDYRTRQLRPKLIEDVQTARAFGDLSENFEYKCAKQEKNRNDSRIRYLQRMIKTAKVIEDKSDETTAGLYDTVEILMENTGKSPRCARTRSRALSVRSLRWAGRSWAARPGTGCRCRWKTAAPTGCKFRA